MKKKVTGIIMASVLLIGTMISTSGCSSLPGSRETAGESSTQSAEEILQEEPLVREAEERTETR